MFKRTFTIAAITSTLAACSATFNAPTVNSVDWQAQGKFHVQALYEDKYGSTSYDEADRVDYLETWVVKKGSCKDGYVIDNTSITDAKYGAKVKHYWGHCT